MRNTKSNANYQAPHCLLPFPPFIFELNIFFKTTTWWAVFFNGYSNLKNELRNDCKRILQLLSNVVPCEFEVLLHVYLYRKINIECVCVRVYGCFVIYDRKWWKNHVTEITAAILVFFIIMSLCNLMNTTDTYIYKMYKYSFSSNSIYFLLLLISIPMCLLLVKIVSFSFKKCFVFV